MRQVAGFYAAAAVGAIVATAITKILFPPSPSALMSQWHFVRDGIQFGISGLALMSQSGETLRLLAVHDNKQPGENRLAVVTLDGTGRVDYAPLSWSEGVELPIDLEAIAIVPDTNPIEYLTLTSRGRAYHVGIDGDTVRVLHQFNLPETPEDNNYEGLALQSLHGEIIAVWAHRGSDDDPAIVYWGKLDRDSWQIEPTGSATLRVPWPSQAVRHISDLRVDPAGVLTISAARDPGNDGPFQSALYIAGAFAIENGAIAFRQNSTLTPLFRYDRHKVEAIEFVPGTTGGAIAATDDENSGSSIWR